ncbi:unnamed protein product [Adineta ricciae]|uniref:Uncharacterized protein n=1 Tax=Adineta ricciae TaxID=249248 RepID=A0A815V657_ADIRI|nr:unnamed protein product [Adineta ricciae]CAF1531771.1 unnamed protein product [Adineta ricciae]
MMKVLVVLFVLSSIKTICLAKQDPPHILHGLFADSDQSHVCYGTFNFDTSQFNITNKIDINIVGDPRNVKYHVLPLTYDPNADVVYMAAPDKNKQTILSVINAVDGKLLSTYQTIKSTIISLQYDIFQKQLFAHIETDQENVTSIVEIDTSDGNIKQTMGTVENLKATHISSYCPICRKYFLMMNDDQGFMYVGVNTSNSGGVDWKTKINFSPLSIKFDYKTFTMYATYINVSVHFVSSVGILDRSKGGISKDVGNIYEDPNIAVTSLSAFDFQEKIYYASTKLTGPVVPGVSYVKVDGSDSRVILLPKANYYSYGWFIKQFIH